MDTILSLGLKRSFCWSSKENLSALMPEHSDQKAVSFCLTTKININYIDPTFIVRSEYGVSISPDARQPENSAQKAMTF